MTTDERRYNIATARWANTKLWDQLDPMTWAESVTWLDLDNPAEAKECGGYVFVELSGGKGRKRPRNKASVRARSTVSLDADTITVTCESFELDVKVVLDCDHVIHTTWSHTPEHPRYRVLAPLSRDVTPGEYRLIQRALMHEIGQGQFDKGSAEPERFMYRPSTQNQETYRHSEVVEGKPLDADLWIAKGKEIEAASEPLNAAEKATAAAVTTSAVAEAVVRAEVTTALECLDAVAALDEEERHPWPGVPEGLGWDSGTFLMGKRLVQAANSGGSFYTIDQAKADFIERAPDSQGNYDKYYKWSEAVKTVGAQGLPYKTAADDFGPVPVEADDQGDRSGGWKPIDLTAYLDGTYTPPGATLMCRSDGVGLLYPAMTHSIHGQSESGKSMIVQGEVAARLKAQQWVLYLDYEADPGSVVERLRLMGVTDEQMSRLAYVQPEADHELSPGTRAAFETLLSRSYALAVLDGVTESLGQAPAKLRSTGGLGGNDDITAWHDRLPKVIAKRTGAAVVMIDHVAKGPDAGRFAIGGQAKMSTITGAAYLVKPLTPLGRDLVGEVELHVAKDRHGYVRSKAGPFDKDRLQLVATAVVDGTSGALDVTLRAPTVSATGDTRLHAVMERVSAFLQALPADHQGASSNLVRSSVPGKNDLVDQALRSLVERGCVSRTTKGQANLHLLVRPFVAGFEEASDD